MFEKPYGYDARTGIFWFFTRSGFRYVSDGTWVRNADPEFLNDLFPNEECDPDPYSQAILEIFAADVANGHGNDIAYMQLNPYLAVSLALEGGFITPAHLASDDLLHHDSQGHYVDIPNVTIGGRLVTIRVRDRENTDVVWSLDRRGVAIP